MHRGRRSRLSLPGSGKLGRSIQWLDRGQSGLEAGDGIDLLVRHRLDTLVRAQLRLQVDYFDIKIENVISTIGASAILEECVNSGNFCNDIHRDPASGYSLWLSNAGYVVDSLANVGQLETRGVDVDASYGFDIGPAGKIRMNLVGTYVDEYIVTPIANTPSTSYNCAGYYGDTCSSGGATSDPVFRWRHTLRTTWSTPWQGIDLTLSWRYFSADEARFAQSESKLECLPGDHRERWHFEHRCEYQGVQLFGRDRLDEGGGQDHPPCGRQ